MRLPSQLQVGWQWALWVCQEVPWLHSTSSLAVSPEMSISTRSSTSSPTRHGVIRVGVVVVAVEGHVDACDQVAVAVGQADEGDHGVLR